MRRNSILATLVVAMFASEIKGSVYRRVIPTECPKRDSTHGSVMLPHEFDCTKFYTCVHGTPVLSQCPVMDQDGNRLHFNPVLQVCDWPSHAECFRGTPTTGTWPTWTSIITGTSRVSTDGSESSPTKTSPAPSDGENIRIPHEYNCSLYYEVVKGEKTLRECPPDLHFSPTQLICRKPEFAGCESGPTPTPACGVSCGDVPDGWLIPHECMCNLYYRCRNGDLIRQQCSNGLHFNANHFSCDYPKSAGCEPTPTTTEATTAKPTTSVIPSQCPPDNSGGPVQFPHPTNCSLFYKCDNGKKQLLQCPNGLHFNPDIQMCDWPDSAGCTATSESAGTSETETQPSAPNVETTTEVSTTESPADVPTTEQPNECPTEEGSQMPHPYNCSLYYVCEDGRKVLHACPPGLEFSPDLGVCDWPEVSGCLASTTTQPPTEGTPKPTTGSATVATSGPITGSETEGTQKPTTGSEAEATPRPTTGSGPEATQKPTTGIETEATQMPTTKVPSTVSPTTEQPNECSNDDTGAVVQLPDSYNCSLYYVCEDGRWVLRVCPDGLEYSPDLQVCDWPEVSGCLASTTARTEPPTIEGTPKPTTGSETEAPPKPTTGSETEAPSKPTTGSETEAPPKPTTGNESEAPPKPATESESEDTPDPATESPSNDTSTLMTQSTVQTSENECPQDNSGMAVHLPHPTNCSLYYKCDNGVKVLQACPAGLEFNAIKQVCDWPSAAGCVASTTQSPTTTIAPPTSSGSPETTVGTSQPETTTVVTECPPEADGRLTPHETNCSLYYECARGEKILQECTPGLHFSPDLEICVWPANAGCESSEIPPGASSTVAEVSTQVNVNPDDNEDPGGPSCIGSCPQQDPEDYTVLLRHEDCAKFCKCSNSVAYVYDCPAGLHFSPISFVCEYPQDAQCEGVHGQGQPDEQTVREY